MKFSTILKQPYVETLREYAPGVDAGLADVTITPAIRPAEKAIVNVLGDGTYQKIKDLPEDDEIRIEFIAALSNLVMFHYKIWETIRKRQDQQKDTYKYELERMQNSYLDNFYAHIDGLIELMTDTDRVPEWKQSDTYKMSLLLLIQDAAEFNTFYEIDTSYFFFFKSVFLQRKVLDKHITPGIDIEKIDEDQKRRVKAITAQLTVAYALRQFDMMAIPRTIRNSGADGPSRSGTGEQDALISLSDFLFDEAQKDLAALIQDINRPEPGQDLPSDTNINDIRNKYYFIP